MLLGLPNKGNTCWNMYKAINISEMRFHQLFDEYIFGTTTERKSEVKIKVK